MRMATLSTKSSPCAFRGVGRWVMVDSRNRHPGPAATFTVRTRTFCSFECCSLSGTLLILFVGGWMVAREENKATKDWRVMSGWDLLCVDTRIFKRVVINKPSNTRLTACQPSIGCDRYNRLNCYSGSCSRREAAIAKTTEYNENGWWVGGIWGCPLCVPEISLLIMDRANLLPC